MSDLLGPGWRASARPLWECHDVALFDLDGVLYVGRDAVPHASLSLQAARGCGLRAGFVTNNAARPPSEVAKHLSEIGMPASSADVVTSAQAGARVLSELVEPGSKVLYIGGEGVPIALKERGFLPVTSVDDDPVALIQGYGRDVGWLQLAQGTYALFRGLPWVATNADRTIPTPQGRALGNGALVAALIHATGATPIVAGKPEPPLMLESVERLAADRPLVVGDRLDTDIEGANRSGIDSMLVLTGVTDWHDLLVAPGKLRPSYLAADLRGLSVAQPEVGVVLEGDSIEATCRSACVRAGVGTLEQSEGPSQQGLPAELANLDPRHSDGLDAIRALVAVHWAAADRGLQVRQMSLHQA